MVALKCVNVFVSLLSKSFGCLLRVVCSVLVKRYQHPEVGAEGLLAGSCVAPTNIVFDQSEYVSVPKTPKAEGPQYAFL